MTPLLELMAAVRRRAMLLAPAAGESCYAGIPACASAAQKASQCALELPG